MEFLFTNSHHTTLLLLYALYIRCSTRTRCDNNSFSCPAHSDLSDYPSCNSASTAYSTPRPPCRAPYAQSPRPPKAWDVHHRNSYLYDHLVHQQTTVYRAAYLDLWGLPSCHQASVQASKPAGRCVCCSFHLISAHDALLRFHSRFCLIINHPLISWQVMP